MYTNIACFVPRNKLIKKIKKSAISKKDKPLSNKQKKKKKKKYTKKIGKNIRRGHLYMRPVFPQVLYITSKAWCAEQFKQRKKARAIDEIIYQPRV